MTNDSLSPLESSTSILDVMQKSQKEFDKIKENQEALEKSQIEQAAITNDQIKALSMLKNMKKKPLTRKNNIGRNDPCPCGSGKKYKNCCLNTGEYEGYERTK